MRVSDVASNCDDFHKVSCLQEEEERGKRQVLVLGLDGAGKSSMLQGLTPGEPAVKRGCCRPTRGFNFMSLNVPACQLDFLESKSRNRKIFNLGMNIIPVSDGAARIY